MAKQRPRNPERAPLGKDHPYNLLEFRGVAGGVGVSKGSSKTWKKACPGAACTKGEVLSVQRGFIEAQRKPRPMTNSWKPKGKEIPKEGEVWVGKGNIPEGEVRKTGGPRTWERNEKTPNRTKAVISRGRSEGESGVSTTALKEHEGSESKKSSIPSPASLLTKQENASEAVKILFLRDKRLTQVSKKNKRRISLGKPHCLRASLQGKETSFLGEGRG